MENNCDENGQNHNGKPQDSGLDVLERRRGPRVPVHLWVEEHQGDDVYFQQAANLSIGGLFFDRTIPHPIGTQVRLKFQLPGTDAVIETTGEVASIPDGASGIGAGIKFVNLDEMEKRIIREFIDEHLKKSLS